MNILFEKLPFRSAIGIILSVVSMLFITVIMAPIGLIFYVISLLLYGILKLKYGKRICRANGLDIFYGMDKSKSNSYCNLLGTCDGNISFEYFKNHTWKRFQMDVYPISSRRLRRYQQKYVTIAGYNYFIDDLNPDMDNHFVQITKEDIYSDPKLRSNPDSIESFIRDEDSNDEFQLMADHVMKKYGNTKMDTNKAQWQIFFYKHENSFSFLFRFNHVIVDGVHFVRFILEEFGEKSIIQPLPYNYKYPGILKKSILLLWAYFLLPIGLSKFFTNPGNNPLHGPELNGNKTRICSEVIPLQDIKEIKHKCKTSFNNIIYACTAYALRCHYRAKGRQTPKTYVVVPVSLQDLRKEIKTKNSHGLMSIMITTESDDVEKDCAVERLRKIEKDLSIAKNDMSFASTQLAIRMFCPLFPRWINKRLLQAKGLTVGVSNIPGPSKERIQIGDTYLRDLTFWIPDRDPMGVAITVLGNMDDLRVGLQVDWALMKTNEEAYDLLENFRKEVYNLRRELGLDPVKNIAVICPY